MNPFAFLLLVCYTLQNFSVVFKSKGGTHLSITVNGEELLTVGESATYLNISRTTFDTMLKDRPLPYLRRPGLGNRKFFKKADLGKLIEWHIGINGPAPNETE